MRQITRITIATIGTAVLLTGGGGIALAANQAATSTTTAVSTTTAAAPAAVTGISYRRAIQIAKERVPGARVTEVEREWEHGHSVWKIELRKGGREYKVYVSATTGRIIKFRRDDR
ncbi:PepSY domain-containing protein [Streptosporangium sp. NPDC087985]|uniref:PepSY domain-containing protein n=1 Tax=Streptosporangium sp. NPDC087985 TaxID=3366196 RepID=UPI00382C7C55